jgi:hypothetical protein
MPRVPGQPEIDEAGAGHVRGDHEAVRRQGGHDGLRELTRIAARRLGQAQGDVAGEVAMLRVARALHHHLVGIHGLGQHAGNKGTQRLAKQAL